MRNFNLLIVMTGIIFFSYSCSKPDIEQSLLEPVFKRCRLSKEFVNNQLWKEVTYKDTKTYEIDRVLYYQNNIVRDDWTETYSYSDGRIASKSDQYNTTHYEYNDHGDLSEIRYCSNASGACYTSRYEYQNNLPVKIVTTYDGGGGFTETLDYTNLDSRSYYYIYQDQAGSSVSSFQKFTEQYINPNGDAFPNGVDYYQNRIIEDYKNRQFIEYLIDPDDTKGRYPTRITELIYTLPEFQQTGQNVYTYEYVGCD